METYVFGVKKPLPNEEDFAEFLDPKRTAVVSIDMHASHLDESPDCPCPAPRARGVVKPIDAFHDRCRELGIPVIHVHVVLRPNGVDDAKSLMPSNWRLTYPLYIGEIPGIDRFGVDRWVEMNTEVKPGDHVVETKKRISSFWHSDLDWLLRNLGTRTVIINGCLTDCCVLNASFDAANLGYRVVVPRDIVAGTNAEAEEWALRIISLHLGLVVDSEDLLEAWDKDAAPALALQQVTG